MTNRNPAPTTAPGQPPAALLAFEVECIDRETDQSEWRAVRAQDEVAAGQLLRDQGQITGRTRLARPPEPTNGTSGAKKRQLWLSAALGVLIATEVILRMNGASLAVLFRPFSSDLRAEARARKQSDENTAMARDQVARDSVRRSDQRLATLDEFKRIAMGMTLSEVEGIIGSPGREVSRSSLAGVTTVMYEWDGSGEPGANMNAMFQNGEAVQKAQSGLR